MAEDGVQSQRHPNENSRKNLNGNGQPLKTPALPPRRSRVVSSSTTTSASSNEPISSFFKRTVNRLQHPSNSNESNVPDKEMTASCYNQCLGIQRAPFGCASFGDDSSAQTSPSSASSNHENLGIIPSPESFVSQETVPIYNLAEFARGSTPDSFRIGIQRNPAENDDEEDFPDHLSIISLDADQDEIQFDKRAKGRSLFEDAWMSDPDEEDEVAEDSRNQSESQSSLRSLHRESTSSVDLPSAPDVKLFPLNAQLPSHAQLPPHPRQVTASHSDRSITAASPIKNLIKSFANDMRRKPREPNSVERERVKSVKIRNPGVSPMMTPRKSPSSTSFENIYVLLLNPQAKIFELIQLSYFPHKTTVGDIVKMIPKHVTEPSLAAQAYVGLTRPRKRAHGFTELHLCLSERSGKENIGIIQGEILVAIPEGGTRQHVVRLAKKILANPRIQKLVVESEKLSSTTKRKKKTSSPSPSGSPPLEKRAKPRTPRDKSKSSSPAQMIPEALEITRLATELAHGAHSVPFVTPEADRLPPKKKSPRKPRTNTSSFHIQIISSEPKVQDGFDSTTASEKITLRTPERISRYSVDGMLAPVSSPGSTISASTTQSSSDSIRTDTAPWKQNMLYPGHPLLSTESSAVFGRPSWANPPLSPVPSSSASFATLKSPVRPTARPVPRSKSPKFVTNFGNIMVAVFFAMVLRYFTDPNGYGICRVDPSEEPLGFMGAVYAAICGMVLVKVQKLAKRSKLDWANEKCLALRMFRYFPGPATLR